MRQIPFKKDRTKDLADLRKLNFVKIKMLKNKIVVDYVHISKRPDVHNKWANSVKVTHVLRLFRDPECKI